MVFDLESSGSGGASVTTDPNPPANPNDGDLWYDTVNAGLYVWDIDLSAWIQTNGGGGSTSPTVGARAVFNGITTTSQNTSTFEGSYNIDRVETSTGGFGDRIYFINPIKDPIVIVPDFQPNYETAPYQAMGTSQRISTLSDGPYYRLYFQDDKSNILTSLRFQGESPGRMKHFVIF